MLKGETVCGETPRSGQGLLGSHHFASQRLIESHHFVEIETPQLVGTYAGGGASGGTIKKTKEKKTLSMGLRESKCSEILHL